MVFAAVGVGGDGDAVGWFFAAVADCFLRLFSLLLLLVVVLLGGADAVVGVGGVGSVGCLGGIGGGSGFYYSAIVFPSASAIALLTAPAFAKTRSTTASVHSQLREIDALLC